MRKFRYNIQFKDRANRVADIITAKPEDVEKLLQQLLNDFEKTNKQLADIATFHAAYRFNITSRQGNSFYVTEIKEVDLSQGTHFLVWHHGYGGVDFKILFQGLYKECKAKRKKDMQKTIELLELLPEDISRNVIDTDTEWEIQDIVEIQKSNNI